jgi:hypothetical protein
MNKEQRKEILVQLMRDAEELGLYDMPYEQTEEETAKTDEAAFKQYWDKVSATAIFGHYHTWKAACAYMRGRELSNE